MKTRHQCKFVLIIYERPLPANRQLQNLIAIPWFWLNVSLENIKNFFIVIKCVNNWLKYVGKCNYSISVFAVDNGECVHIHCVQNVYSEYKYGEKRGDWSDQRRERELVFRNYWSQYGHNNATQPSARPMGSTNHLSLLSLKSTIIDWKELIPDIMWTQRASDIESGD